MLSYIAAPLGSYGFCCEGTHSHFFIFPGVFQPLTYFKQVSLRLHRWGGRYLEETLEQFRTGGFPLASWLSWMWDIRFGIPSGYVKIAIENGHL
jgi:hypothetical protein